MTKRFTASTIANTLFDPVSTFTLPVPMAYGLNMTFINTLFSQTQSLPSIEQAAETLHDKGMSKDDLIILSRQLRHFLLERVAKDLASPNLHVLVSTDPEKYLGLRLAANITPFEKRDDLQQIKADFTANLSTLMEQKPGLFNKTPTKRAAYGRRNFGLNH